jgi:hypothetical protein
MAINFPDSPSVSDTHVVGNSTWVWNGATWKDIFDSAGSPVQAQIDAKANIDAPAFTGAVDFTSATVTGIDLLPTQTGENGNYLTTDGSASSWAAIEIPPGTVVSDAAPSTPDAGQLWWNSSDGTLYIYYDSFWIEAVTGVIGATGATGITGDTGVTGNTGTIGNTGTNGVDGDDGTFASTQTIETKAADYSLVAADAGKLILNSAAVTITVEGLAVGEQVDFLQNVAGQITFVAGTAMTLNSKDGYLITAVQYSAAGVKCIATDTYVLIGDLGV